ncbi:MAG: leucine-rich repeat protein [Clostridiales Family XIII bacterium]|jgi:hypothetical protein|nr:leucine-rich repeat protein [Clostridiales Family XIII bacterium]
MMKQRGFFAKGKMALAILLVTILSVTVLLPTASRAESPAGDAAGEDAAAPEEGAGISALDAAPETDFIFDAAVGTITVYLGSAADLEIPAAIGGAPVTAIGDMVFRNKGIESVTLPATLTAIGKGAFQENNLTAVDIPDSVAVIGENAFAYNKLTAVDLPAGLTALGAFAFRGNELAAVTTGGASAWPIGLTALSEGVFMDNKLSEAGLPAFTGSAIAAIGGSAFELNFFSAIEIPPSVAAWGARVFANNGRYVTLTLTGEGNPGIHTASYANAFGEIIAPAAIHVTYVDPDGAELYSAQTIQSDLTQQAADAANLIYVGNGSYPLAIMPLAGYKFTTAAGGTVNGDKTAVNVPVNAAVINVKLVYARADSGPVIIGLDPISAAPGNGDITEARLREGVTAGDIDGNDLTSAIQISVALPAGKTIPLDTSVPATYTIKYSVTDTQSPPKTTEMLRTVTIAADPMDAEIGNGWQYKDFVYGTADNWPFDNYDKITVYSVVGLSASGKAKYDAGNKNLVLPGYHPGTADEPAITPILGLNGMSAERAYYSQKPQLAEGGPIYFEDLAFDAIDLSRMKDLRIISNFSFAGSKAEAGGVNFAGLDKLEYIGHSAFEGMEYTGDLDLTGLLSLKQIGKNSFELYTGTDGELKIKGLSNLTIIGLGAFNKYNGNNLDLSGLTALTSLEGNTSSFNGTGGVFQSYNGENLNLTGLSSLSNLGQAAFYSYNSGLSAEESKTQEGKPIDFSGMPNLKVIGTDAFHDYRGFDRTLDLSPLAQLQEITDNVFRNFIGKKIDLSGLSNLKGIRNYAFENFEGAGYPLDFSDCVNLESIGYSFRDFNGSDLIFGALPKLTSIGDYSIGFPAYRGAGKALDLSGLTAVGDITDDAFKSFIGTEVILPASPNYTKIKSGTFAGFNGKLTGLYDIANQLSGIYYKAFGSYNPANPADYIDFTKFPNLTVLAGFTAYNPDAAIDLSACTQLTGIYKIDPNNVNSWQTGLDFRAYAGLGRTLDLSHNTALVYLMESAFKSFNGDAIDLSNLVNLEEIRDSAFESYAGTGAVLDLSHLTKLKRIGIWAFRYFDGSDIDFSNLRSLKYIGSEAFLAYKGYMLDLSDLVSLVELGSPSGPHYGVFGSVKNETVVRGFENLTSLEWISCAATGARYPEGGVLDLSNSKINKLDYNNFDLRNYGDIIVYLPAGMTLIDWTAFTNGRDDNSAAVGAADQPATELYLFIPDFDPADSILYNSLGPNKAPVDVTDYHKRFHSVPEVQNPASIVNLYINNMSVIAVCKLNDAGGAVIANVPMHVFGKFGEPLEVPAPLVPGYRLVPSEPASKAIAAAAINNAVEFYYEKDGKEAGSTIVIDIHNLKNTATGQAHEKYTIGEDMPLEVTFSASGNVGILEGTTIVIPLHEFAENVRVTGDVVGVGTNGSGKFIKEWYVKDGNLYVVLNNMNLSAGDAMFQFSQQFSKYDTPWDRTETYAAYMYGAATTWSNAWDPDTNEVVFGSKDADGKAADPKAFLASDEDFGAKLIGFEYRQPGIRKYANGEFEDEPIWINAGELHEDGGKVVGAPSIESAASLNPASDSGDADALAKLNEITYTFEMTGQYYRNIDSFILYDKLPSYIDKDGNSHYGVFEAESNPDWTLVWGHFEPDTARDATGNTPKFTAAGGAPGANDAPYAVYTSAVFAKTVSIQNNKLPALKVKFPGAAVNQEPVVNTVTIEAFVHNENNSGKDLTIADDPAGRQPKNNDKHSFFASDDVTIALYAYGPGGIGGFDKRAESIHYSRNRYYYFYDDPIEKAAVYSWSVASSNASELPYENVVFEDFGLDEHSYTSAEGYKGSYWDDQVTDLTPDSASAQDDLTPRMRYYGVNLDGVPAGVNATIKAYGSGADGIVGTADDPLISEDIAEGGTTYKFEASKREGITRIVISFPGHTMQPGESLGFHVLTELTDEHRGRAEEMLYTPVHENQPELDDKQEILQRPENKFPNWASFHAEYTLGTETTQIDNIAKDWIRIIPIRNALSVTKSANIPGGFTILNAGTLIDYTVGYQGERAQGFYPQKFVLVDLLPIDVELIDVELSEEFKKSPNARYEIEVGYNGTDRTAIIFKADELVVTGKTSGIYAEKVGEFGDTPVGYIHAKMGITMTDPSGAQRVYNEAYLYGESKNPSYPFVLGNVLPSTNTRAETESVLHDLGYSADDILRYFEAVHADASDIGGAYRELPVTDKAVDGESYAMVSNQALKGSYFQGLKWIRKEGGAWSTTGVETEPGGNVYYRLDIVNQTNVPRKDVVAWDIFPNAGDILLDSAAGSPVTRGSKFSNTLAGPVALPADLISRGWTVLYTVKANAVNTRAFMAEDTNWQTAGELGFASDADYAAVTGIKIVSANTVSYQQENAAMGPMESVHITYRMTAPTDLQYAEQSESNQKRAWNTFSVTDDIAKDSTYPNGRPLEANNVYNKISKPKRNITLTKVDENNAPLAGALFELVDSDTGQVIATQSSDAFGYVNFKDVPADKTVGGVKVPINLLVRESKAPAAYTGTMVQVNIPNSVWMPEGWNQDEVYTFAGDAAVDAYTLTYVYDAGAQDTANNYSLNYRAAKALENTKNPPPPDLGAIEIEKTDGSGAALSGAVFTIVGQDAAAGASPGNADINIRRITNTAGKLRVADLPIGYYAVTEVSAPGKLTPDYTAVVLVEKDKTAYVGLVGDGNGGFEPGYGIGEGGADAVQAIVNDRAAFSLVKIGIYHSGFQILPNNQLDPSMGEKLKDVEFQLYEGRAEDYAASPDTAAPASGITYTPAAAGGARGITGADGKLAFSGLKTGEHYTLAEIPPQDFAFTLRPGAEDVVKGPDGVLGTSDDLLGVYDIYITPDGRILLDGESITTSDLVIGNDSKTFSFRALIAKTDQANNPVPGVFFTVAADAKGSHALTVGPTDANGTIALTEAAFEAVKEANAVLYNAFMAGSPLYVTEVAAPDGHTIPAGEEPWIIYRNIGYQTRTFVNNKTTLDLFKYQVVAKDLEETLQYLGLSDILERVLAEKGAAHHVRLSDLTEGERTRVAGELTPDLAAEPADIMASAGELELRKGVEGATLQVSIKGKPYTAYDPADPSAPYTGFTAATRADGRLPIPDGFLFLSDETYEVKETIAPENYLLSGKTLSFKPDTLKALEGYRGTISLVLENRPELGQLVVTKLSEQGGQTLAGVKFGLYEKVVNGGVLGTGAQIAELATDENGLAVFKNLPYGDYVLKETEPLDGYVFDESNPGLFAVTVSAAAQTVYITVYNAEESQFSSLLLTKYDDNGRPDEVDEYHVMSGVAFKLEKWIPILGAILGHWETYEGEDAIGKYGGDTEDPGTGNYYPLRKTDAQGRIYFGMLPKGTYRIVEIRDEAKYKEPVYTDGGGEALGGADGNEFTVNARQQTDIRVKAVNPLITIPRVADLALEKNAAAYQVEDQDAPVSGVYKWQDATGADAENISIAVGNLVLFKLRVWNEGKIPATPEEITDYIPEGLLFVAPDDPVYRDIRVGNGQTSPTVADINKYWTVSAGKSGFSQFAKYDWVKARAGGDAPRTLFVDPKLQTIADNLDAPIPSAHYADGKDKVSSFEIPILLKVAAKNTDKIVNWAEISKETAPKDPDKPYDPENPDEEVEDIDSTPDDDPHNDFEDGKDGEDDIDFAAIIPILLQLDVQIDKDTIKQTSSMYNTLYSTENYENVGKDKERYRYDINFRSLANMRLDEYIVTDPFESADPSIDQTRMEELWTPLAWGDVDGKVDVLYKTHSGSGISGGAVPSTMDNGQDGAYSNAGWKVWALGIPANAPGPQTHLLVSDLGLAEGDYVTAIRFSYGSVKVGFTTLNTARRSVNGQHRDTITGVIDSDMIGEIDSIPAGESKEMKTLAAADGFAPLRALVNTLAAPFGFAPLAAPDGGVKALAGEGLEANRLNWAPSQGDPYYAQGAAAATGLKPATYLVKPPREADGYEEIVSSAYSIGARNVLDPVDGKTVRSLMANDQDAVRTLTIGTFIPGLDPDPDTGELVREDSFEEKLGDTAGIVYRDGKFVDRSGNEVKSLTNLRGAAATGDETMPGLWAAALTLAGALLILLLVRARLRRKQAKIAVSAASSASAATSATAATAAAKTGALILAAALLGGTLFLASPAEPAYAAETESAPADNTLEVEFRYADGQEPQIPTTITRGGVTWTYVSASAPARVDTIENNTQRSVLRFITGRLRLDQYQAALDMGIELTPVDLRYERRIDKEISFTEEYEQTNDGYAPVGPLEYNDVAMLPQEWDFAVASADSDSGETTERLAIAEISFEPIQSNDGLPARYRADCVFRGVESYTDTGYFTADGRIELITGSGTTDVWLVSATFIREPEAIAAPQAEDPTESVTTTEEIVNEETALLDSQTGNLISDIANGRVPLGNVLHDDAWSLLSLILSVAGVISAALILISLVQRRTIFVLAYERETREEKRKAGKFLGIFASAAGVLTLISWLVLDNLNLPVIWINKWTPAVAAVFAIHIILVFLYRRKKVQEDRDDREEDSFAVA